VPEYSEVIARSANKIEQKQGAFCARAAMKLCVAKNKSNSYQFYGD
jgi:hypothetical protein